MKKREFLKISAKAGFITAIAPTMLLQACNEGNANANSKLLAANFSLPKLQYGYGEYNEAVDALTMEIHHSKHHQGYINKLNAALKDMPTEASSLENLLAGDDPHIAFRQNGGGHFNHSLFWETLKPGGEAPSESFKTAVNQYFNSWDNMIAEMQTAGKKRFGSGWAWLCQDNNSKELFITSTKNQDNPLMAAAERQGKPLLGIDVWEHAYYLKYQNRRGEYLGNIMNIIDWKAVESNMI